MQIKGSVLFCLLFVSLFKSFSQQIAGNIVDKAGHSIEFVNLALQKTSDSTFVSGTISDTSGYYLFERLKPGRYRLVAHQVGYQKGFSDIITVTETSGLQKVDFQLEEEHVQLGEVVIQAQKPVILQEPGKITVNIENTVSASGLMAIDLLKRMPGVQVDNNGNISLKGKSEVLFMIDGKPSNLSAKQIAVILRSLPSNQISNIEIITSPSAKYDARGNAGIININLKKSDKKGVNGNVQASYGHGFLHKSNVGGGISAGWKKWQVNAMYDYANNRNLDVSTQQRNIGGQASGNRYHQDQRYEVPTQTHNWRASLDYNPTPKLSLGLNHRGMYIEDRWTSNNNGTIVNSEGQTIQQIESHDNNPNYNSDLAVSGSGKYKLDTLGQEISADGEVSRYIQRSWQNIHTSIHENGSASIWDFHSHQPLNNLVWWAKMDYVKPITKKLKLESGIKSTQVHIDNLVEYFVSKTGDFDAPIPPNNSFKYSEQVNAAYVAAHLEAGKWGLQLGLRGEHWRAQGDLARSSFTRDSLQLFPNLMAKYKLHDKHEISFAGSRRIDRPNYLMLNPIAYYSDPYSYYAGNPRIKPQSTYNAELSHNFASGLIITTLNYSLTSNFIYDFATYQTSDTSKIQFLGPVNVPQYQNYGLSTSLNFPVTKWWSSQIFMNIYHNQFEGRAMRYEVNYSTTSFSANTTQQFTLPASFAAELSGNYSSPSYYGYTHNKQMGMVSIGIKKEWMAGRLSTKLNFQDIFYTFQYRGSVDIPELNMQYVYRWDNRVVNLSAVWKFEKKAELLKEMK